MSHAEHGDEDNLKESAGAAKDAVVDLAGEAGRYARDSAAAVIDGVKSRASEYNSTAVEFIRRNPYQSIAIAAAVGLAAGLLLRRR